MDGIGRVLIATIIMISKVIMITIGMIGKTIIGMPTKRVKTHGIMVGTAIKKRIKIMLIGGILIHGIITTKQLPHQITKQLPHQLTLFQNALFLNTPKPLLKSTGT